MINIVAYLLKISVLFVLDNHDIRKKQLII